MKRIAFILMLACAVCAIAPATEIVYVSASGDDDSLWSEGAPLKTLDKALLIANLLAIVDDDVRIVVIGTLNAASEGSREDEEVFHIWTAGERQILITGKPGATGSERAVLSGRGSGTFVVHVDGAIRFENIEISGGEGEPGVGIGITTGDTNVTLGPGAVVRGNSRGGIIIIAGTLTVNGGEVRDNNGPGIIVGDTGVLTMRSGTIRDNRSSGNTGGVGITNGGRFTMTGGTITGNRATRTGGGVYVMSGGRFDQTGGTISNNTAGQGSNPNVYRESGSLGSNLTPGSGGSASSGSSGSSSSSSPSSSGFDWDIVWNFGIYVQGLNMNTVSFGFPLRLGVEFDFGNVFSLALLGEAGGGVGAPYMIEFNYGGMAEMYILNKSFGFGFGIGSHNALLPYLTNMFGSSRDSSGSGQEESMISSNYIRLALIFRKDEKLSLYAQLYNSGQANGKWGLGISWMY